MHRYFFLIVLCGFVFLVSCVPNRKIIYLQKEPGFENKKQPKDSVVRHYDLEPFDYKIQTNDIISVRYQSLTDQEFDYSSQGQVNAAGNTGNMGGALLRGELVDEHGEIPMMVVGKVKVAGLTLFQVQDTLQKIANRFLESTIVKVRLLNYRVTVLGEVNSEGTIVFSNNRVTLMEAIGQAGGLGELADRSNIKVIRQKNSKTEVHYVDILKEDFMKSPFYYVHQNDLIIVPPLRQRPFRKYFSQNISFFLSGISVLLLIISLNKK
jgi:polysaccharide export outer membrane protein